MSNKKIAIIRIRGLTGINQNIKDTLDMLRLYKKNYCVVVEENPSYKGMINLVKDYVTWGEIDQATYDELVSKRGEEYKGRTQDSSGKIQYNKYITVGDKKLKPYFRLNPPIGGFEQKGTKQPFSIGGSLGNRKVKMAELIKRMI